MKIGINLSRQEILMFKDVKFQFQQRESLSPRGRFSTIAMLPISRTDVHVPLNPDTHPTSRFDKAMCHNLLTLTKIHKYKWERTGLIDGYYMVGVNDIPYPRFGVLINIGSKEDIVYHITIGDIPHCTCPDFIKCHLNVWEKKKIMCVLQTYLSCA